MSVRRGSSGRRASTWTTAAALALVAAACGGGGSTESAVCDDETVTTVDPQSVVHVLPGAPSPDYPTELPTSGVHVMNPRVEVVSPDPLEPAVAVGVLERRGVVIEHAPGVAERDRIELESLATEDEGTVVVAPGVDLPGAVVARAWRTTLRCDDVDLARLEAFVDDHLGSGSAMTQPDPAG